MVETSSKYKSETKICLPNAVLA